MIAQTRRPLPGWRPGLAGGGVRLPAWQYAVTVVTLQHINPGTKSGFDSRAADSANSIRFEAKGG